MRLTVSAVFVIVVHSWTIDVDYSVDGFSNVHSLGRIELHKQYDGNWTGSYTPKVDSVFVDDLKSNIGGIYQIRAVGSTEKGKVLTSFTPVCYLLKSRLFHQFWVAVDGERQILHSVTVFPDVLAAGGKIDYSTECSINDVPSSNPVPGGTVHVVNKGTLPSPDTQSFVNKMEKERKARQHGAESDNRSFLAKYWMYIVPIFLFMVISNAMNPEQGGGGAEGQ